MRTLLYSLENITPLPTQSFCRKICTQNVFNFVHENVTHRYSDHELRGKNLIYLCTYGN